MNFPKGALPFLLASSGFHSGHAGGNCWDACHNNYCYSCAANCGGSNGPITPPSITKNVVVVTEGSCIERCMESWCDCMQQCEDEGNVDPTDPSDCELEVRVPLPDRNMCDNETEIPSAPPSLSIAPSLSTSPSSVPTATSPPSLSAAPSRACTCCECTHSSGCNPDPHFSIWDGTAWYDFQGGCDQIAIDNPIMQLQIRTRPRTYYSTITQLALLMKDTNEVFRLHSNGTVEQGITSASGATYSNSPSYTHRFDFASSAGVSFMQFNNWGSGLSVQVQGQGVVFTDSEGMYGSWNYGGVRFRNGTAFDLSGGYYDVKARSPALAMDWMVPLAENLLWEPSTVCDASSACGSGETFECDDTRRLSSESDRRLQVVECNRTCDDIPVQSYRDQCKTDANLTGEPESNWACEPNYVNPVVSDSPACQFVQQDEEQCAMKSDICQRLGGYCKKNCKTSDTHVCLNDLCNFEYTWPYPWVEGLSEAEAVHSAGCPRDHPPIRPPSETSDVCQCYVPVECAKAP